MLNKILKAISEGAACCVYIFMFGFMIMAAMGYAQERQYLGCFTCLCGTVVSIFAIAKEVKTVEALCANYEEDSEMKED